MSFDRRTILLLPVVLAACGFTPVYAPGGTAYELRGKVRVQAPETQDEYALVKRLEEQLLRPSDILYLLDFSLTTSTEGQAVTAAGDITRYSLVGKVTYTLRRSVDDLVIAKGKVENFTGTSATGSTIETLASDRDAHKRLMVTLADQLTNQLYSTVDLSQ